MNQNVQTVKSDKKMIVLLCIIAVGVICSMIMSGYSLYYWNKAKSSIDMGETRENDVVIADQYTIKSTEQISDAYKSGNTSSLSDTDKETLNMASNVLDKIIKDGMSDYEKEKAVYDWITANIKNDDGGMTVVPTVNDESDNPHGALKNHTAVCVGYATTFRMFMQMMDIPCKIVHNSEKYHSWDLVQIDGHWYHVDCYSDAASGNYSSFNLNDTMMGSGQNWDRDYFPSADSLDYNPAYQNRKTIKDAYDIPKMIRKALEDKQNNLSFQFEKDLSDKEQNIIYQMMNTLSSAVASTEDYSNYYMDYNFTKDDDGTLFIINLSTYENDDSNDDDVSDKTQKKIDKAVKKAFGDIASDDYGDDIIGKATADSKEVG